LYRSVRSVKISETTKGFGRKSKNMCKAIPKRNSATAFAPIVQKDSTLNSHRQTTTK